MRSILGRSFHFLKAEYFTSRQFKIIFLEIHEYVSQYDALPSLNALSIECQERTDLTEEQFKEVLEVLNVLSNDPADYDWLVDTTEKWCQERAIYLSLMESVKIADGQDSKRDKGAIPSILSEALGVSFDPMLVMIMSLMLRHDLISIIGRKTRFHLIWNCSTRSLKVVWSTNH